MKVLVAFMILLAAGVSAQSVQLTSFAQPPGKPVQPGTTDYEILQFRLYRDAGAAPADCTGVSVSLLGTAVQADWTAIKVYKDADNSGDISAGDPLLASATSLTAGKAVLSGFAEPLAEGFSAGTDFLVSVDVAAGATPDHTFQFKLALADVIVSAGTVAGPASGITSNVHTVRVDSGAEIGVLLGSTALVSGTAGAANIGYIPPSGGSIVLTIENTGVNPLLLTGAPTIAISALINCTATVNGTPATMIDPSQNIMVTIDIMPGGLAPFSFRMDIENNDFDEHPFIQYFGGSAVPNSTISIEYNSTVIPKGGTVQVGTFTAGIAALLTFTVFNNGSGDLLLTGSPIVEVPSESNVTAELQTPPATVVPPAGSTMFTLEFVPIGSGNWLLQFYIESNDTANNPFTAVVQGDAPPVTPSEIRVYTQPADAFAGHPFGTSAVVAVTDANGAVDHSNNTVQATASITPGTGSGGAKLGGTKTRTAVDGYIYFTDLEIDKTGTAYTLTFTHANGAFTSVVSAPFDVTKPPKTDDDNKSTDGGGCSAMHDATAGWMWAFAYACLLLASRTAVSRRSTEA